MNYGIKNIHFDYGSSEIEGTAEVGKVIINFRKHAGSGEWEAWVDGQHSATCAFRMDRDKALRSARKYYGWTTEVNAQHAVTAALDFVECR